MCVWKTFVGLANIKQFVFLTLFNTSSIRNHCINKYHTSITQYHSGVRARILQWETTVSQKHLPSRNSLQKNPTIVCLSYFSSSLVMGRHLISRDCSLPITSVTLRLSQKERSSFTPPLSLPTSKQFPSWSAPSPFVSLQCHV